tara:strand:- start:94 stop:534 length:441 start_codon:yes stop_codon:yes gene_type:complete
MNQVAQLVILAFLLFGCASSSDAKDCSSKGLFEKSKHISGDRLTPNTVYEYYTLVNSCDAFDGIIGMAFQEISNELLADQWDSLLGHPSIKNIDYQKTLIRYISDGSEKRQFDKICKNIVTNCQEKTGFCSKIRFRCKELQDYLNN